MNFKKYTEEHRKEWEEEDRKDKEEEDRILMTSIDRGHIDDNGLED